MKLEHRFRRAEQLRFFHPHRVLPPWTSLPRDVREAVTRLTAEMLRQYWVDKTSTEVEGKITDE